MKLRRVVLTSNNRTAILQGMIHLGPDRLYETIQRDLDQSSSEGSKIFYEKVSMRHVEEPRTENEKKIRELFDMIPKLYPFLADMFGLSFQMDKITYPKESINADVTYSELTAKLDRNGFVPDVFLKFLEVAREKVKPEDLKKAMFGEETNPSLNTLLDNKPKTSLLSKIIIWYLTRKLFPVLLDYRNEVAVKIILSRAEEKNVYIHYGEKHVDGILHLFKRNGWRVTEISYLDLAEFC